MADMEWKIEIGESFERKTSILSIIGGGNVQSGINPLKQSHDVAVFSKDRSARLNGYSDREGMQPDGVFLYAAQGTRGDQNLDQWPNRKILETANNGGVIRLFVYGDHSWQYVGPFGLAEKPYIQTNSSPMQYAFCLVAQGADTSKLSVLGTEAEPRFSEPVLGSQPWSPKTTDLAKIPEKSYATRQALQSEHVLEKEFGEWLRAQNKELKDLTIHVAGVDIKPDLYNATDNEIVEAKSSQMRGYVRTAIGQVLDYANNFYHRHTNPEDDLPQRATPALLLPSSPDPDLVELCHVLKIKIYCRGNDAFVELTHT